MIRKWNVRYSRDDVESMTLNWDGINFPNLQALKFDHNYESKAGSMSNSLIFLQEILQNSKNLKHFALENRFLQTTVDISSLILPATVESLLLNGTLATKNLTILQNNKLQNLKTLKLKICAQEEVDVMVKIFG